MTLTQESVPGPEAGEELFEKLDKYPWHLDEEFHSGLRAIVDANPEQQENEALILQARCFYYSRKFDVPIDVAAYQRWHQARAASGTQGQQTGDDATSVPASEQKAQQGSGGKPPYPLSFNHLVELITEGKEVPGIKEIPDTVLEGQASTSTTAERKKPWEKA